MGKLHDGGGATSSHHHHQKQHHHQHHHHSSQQQQQAGEDTEVEILKTSWMTKRSQLKSRFSLSNYKERWFVLTRTALAYYDGADVAEAAAVVAGRGASSSSSAKRAPREKGRVLLRDVRLVERVQLREGDAKPHSFQVGYLERQQPYYLYIQVREKNLPLPLLLVLLMHATTYT